MAKTLFPSNPSVCPKRTMAEVLPCQTEGTDAAVTSGAGNRNFLTEIDWDGIVSKSNGIEASSSQSKGVVLAGAINGLNSFAENAL